MYGPTETTRFATVERKRSLTGKCTVCGARCSRTYKASQTINPWNRRADGAPKSRAEIVEELDAEIAKLLAGPLTHSKCEGA